MSDRDRLRKKSTGTPPGPRDSISDTPTRPPVKTATEPEKIKSGIFKGQIVRPLSPDRETRIMNQLKVEFPKKSGGKLPLMTDLQGRALELTLIDYLQNPRSGGTSFDTIDPNLIDKSFPALDILASGKPQSGESRGQWLSIQSKAHLQDTVKKRSSAIRSDLKKTKDDKKVESLAKRLHPTKTSPGEKSYEKYTQLSGMMTSITGDDDPMIDAFSRIDVPRNNSDYDRYLTETGSKREDVMQVMEDKIIYPASPKTAEYVGEDNVHPMPFSTEHLRDLISNTKIPTRKQKPRSKKRKNMDDEDPDFIPPEFEKKRKTGEDT